MAPGTNQQKKSTNELKQEHKRSSNDEEDGMLRPNYIYRTSDVLRIYNISKPTLYRWIKRGNFPPPSLLGGAGTRAVGWQGCTLMEHQDSLEAA